MRILIIVFLATFCSFYSCDSNNENNGESNNENISIGPELTTQYSENLETLALIYSLSESGDAHFQHNPEPRAMLARELTKKFEQYKDHEAVQKLNYLLNNDFVDSYDILLSIYNTDLPDFKQYADYAPIYYENDSLSTTQVRAVFVDFNESVKKFYEDAHLYVYFRNEGKPLYDKLMQEVISVAPTSEYIKLMEEYYGINRNSYTIIVSAASFNGIGRSITIRTENGVEIYQFVASNPELESDTINLKDINLFTIGYTDKDYFREIATHELGHSFFQELFRENKEIIAKVSELDYLFTDSLRQDMMRQGYIDWNMCFEEHIVRLGEIKIAEQLGNKSFVAEYTKECTEERGFLYFKQIQELLLEYENNRDSYPTNQRCENNVTMYQFQKLFFKSI